jgi:predicted TIM-barrel fold metal-dependent hydrolase
VDHQRFEKRGKSLNIPVIDCDLHNEVPSSSALLPYITEPWATYLRSSGFTGPDASDYPRGAPTSVSALPEDGEARPGSALEWMRREALEPWGSETGVLTCIYRVQSVHNEDLAAALATAVNRWQVDQWLDSEPRLRGSLVVPSQNPVRAALEIERWGGHPGFVQVLLPARSDAPYGNDRYDPILEAAVRHDLAIGIHAGGAPGFAPTPAGWPATYLEELCVVPLVFQAQLTSITFGGVFQRFPTLRVALIESGFTWLPAWFWRADKDWKSLRAETPWLRRPPSEYVREHVRLTVQPLDAPADAPELLDMIERLESDDLLMFSTDYPHSHFATPGEAVPRGLPEGVLRKVMSDNARRFYRL